LPGLDGPSELGTGISRLDTDTRVSTKFAYGTMGNLELEDSDRFKAVVSQEKARLSQLHPTPEDTPTCMTVFDDFLSCNSMSSSPSPSLFLGFLTHKINKNYHFSSRYSAQVDIPLWRDGTLLSKMERVQVLHEHQGPTPGTKARCVDTSPGGVVGETETGVE
jgi:hypothetical protein